MKASRAALVSILLLGVGIVGGGCGVYTTGENEVGVRTVKFALFEKRGVKEKAYEPGRSYFFPLSLNDWHTFDTKLQNMEMTLKPHKGDRKGRDDLVFKTIDGNDISLDVIISYRIDPRKAPMILQKVATNDKKLREKIVRTVTRSLPRDIFGELKTEEFYVANKRDQKAREAKVELNRILNPYGIIVEKVLTKDYRFNPAYQKAIEDRKVADQRAEKLKSETRAAEEEYRRRLEEAKGQVNEMVAKADGEYLSAKIAADALYEKKRRAAEAIEAEGMAEAKGIERMNNALAGKGGKVMVKLKIAEALQGKRILLLPTSGRGIDIKTTDINRLLEVYGLQGIANPSIKSKPAKEKGGK